MSNVRPDFEDFRSRNFVDIGRIRRVAAAIENFVVNGVAEKSQVHRLESRIFARKSMGFRTGVAGGTISPSSFEGFVKKNRTGNERGGGCTGEVGIYCAKVKLCGPANNRSILWCSSTLH